MNILNINEMNLQSIVKPKKSHDLIKVNVAHELADYMEDDKITYDLEFSKDEKGLKLLSELMYTFDIINQTMFMDAISQNRDLNEQVKYYDYITDLVVNLAFNKDEVKLFYCDTDVIKSFDKIVDFNLDAFINGLRFMLKYSMFTTFNEDSSELLTTYYPTAQWFDNGKEFVKSGIFNTGRNYNVFAVSENGTETIHTSLGKRDAELYVLSYTTDLKHKRFKNNTSLENITSFSYDEM